VLDRYDLVSFDPRGVGQSTPISCDLPAADLPAVNLRPWPAPDGDISVNVDRARRVASDCAGNGGDLMAHISTLDEVRDIDRIRAALGEDRISYWGVSYGTYVGAVYAMLFPRRTDRVLLDSNDDPDPRRVERAWLDNYTVGVEDRFPDFAAWAAARDDTYHLGAGADAVRATFLDLAVRLDAHPLPWPGAEPGELSGNGLRETLLESLYSDAQFPRLASIMLAARSQTPLPPNPAPPEQAVQNGTAVVVATLCNDVGWPGSIADYESAVADSRARFPLTGGMPANIGPCTFWPYAPARAVRVTANGPSNVLLVQNLRDVATPYRGALELREAFGDRARMVSVDSGGHEAYLANGNACGDRLVSRFLATGERPARDVLCPR
jgi:pimeloyl-ACP methyl ester carboxylesterase